MPILLIRHGSYNWTTSVNIFGMRYIPMNYLVYLSIGCQRIYTDQSLRWQRMSGFAAMIDMSWEDMGAPVKYVLTGEIQIFLQKRTHMGAKDRPCQRACANDVMASQWYKVVITQIFLCRLNISRLTLDIFRLHSKICAITNTCIIGRGPLALYLHSYICNIRTLLKGRSLKLCNN